MFPGVYVIDNCDGTGEAKAGCCDDTIYGGKVCPNSGKPICQNQKVENFFAGNSPGLGTI
jgi:hypothetical protein